MTEALITVIETEAGALTGISDPVERFNRARDLRAQLDRGDRILKDVEQSAVIELKEGRPWREVGELLGMTGSRAEQISRGK